jgi:hypothetical protein
MDCIIIYLEAFHWESVRTATLENLPFINVLNGFIIMFIAVDEQRTSLIAESVNHGPNCFHALDHSRLQSTGFCYLRHWIALLTINSIHAVHSYRLALVCGVLLSLFIFTSSAIYILHMYPTFYTIEVYRPLLSPFRLEPSSLLMLVTV